MTKLLVSLLALQIVVAGAIFYSNQQKSDFDTEKSLLGLTAADVEKIVIEGEDSSAVLQKSGDAWVLPELQSLPVSQSKIDEILDKLETTKSGWPVASSGSSQTRLEVDEETFQRKISLGLVGGNEKQLLMGTSPGYRSIHARVEGQDDIYNVKLAKFDFPDSNDDWFDRNLLELKDFNRIKSNDVEIEKTESEWKLVEGPLKVEQEQRIDSDKIKKITDLFADLSVIGVAEDAPSIEDSVDVTVTKDQASWTYQFFSDDENKYVRRSDRDTIFVISKNSYDTASQVNFENLVVENQPLVEEAEEAPAKG